MCPRIGQDTALAMPPVPPDPAAIHEAALHRLGDLVRGLRKDRKWSRRVLAENTGISERFLADVESGRANPSLKKFFTLCEALDAQPAELLAASFGGVAGAHAGNTRQPTLALLGLRGAGKSTVGALLAERLQCPFIELDRLVEEIAGIELGEMFELHGEAHFRRVERQALEQVLASKTPQVVATGGGLVTEEATFKLLRDSAWTAWLRATPEEHWERVTAQGDRRPMSVGVQAFTDLRGILADRVELYRLADVTVETSGREPAAIAGQLAERFAWFETSDSPAGSRS